MAPFRLHATMPLMVVLASASFASRDGAQVRAAIDSAAVLNRAGEFERVAAVTGPAMSRADSVEKCELLLETMWAGAHLWRVTGVARLLQTFDTQCSHAPIATARARDLEQIRATVEMPPMMTARPVDWSAVDAFWMAVDTLSAGREPSWNQWRSLVTTPGYRLAMLSHADLPRQIRLAFSPALRARRDSILQHASSDSTTISHLLDVARSRRELAAYRASIEATLPDSIATAVRNATSFLPAGAEGRRSPPVVAITIFASDGYSQQPGVVLDLYHIRENGLVSFLSHEFNHAYASSFDQVIVPSTSPDFRLFNALRSLRNEGIADMIDKPYPLRVAAGMQWYADAYNKAYAASPTKLHTLDSLLVAASTADSAKLVDIGTRAQQLLPYGSHPNGAYMARTILETFGRDSLIATVPSAFAFIRMFRAASATRGDEPVFSAAGVAELDAMERRFGRTQTGASRE